MRRKLHVLLVCDRAGARTNDPWLCSQTHCRLISEATSEKLDALSECEPPHDQTDKIAFAPSEGSDQSGYPPSLISVFAVRSVGS